MISESELRQLVADTLQVLDAARNPHSRAGCPAWIAPAEGRCDCGADEHNEMLAELIERFEAIEEDLGE